MGKFFMPKQVVHRPLANIDDENFDNSQKKYPKKSAKIIRKNNKHYKAEIYEELLALFRLKHLKYVSQAVSNLKEAKENSNQETKQIKIKQKQEILGAYTSIKKKDFKKIAIHLMKNILKIDPTHTLDKKTENSIKNKPDSQEVIEKAEEPEQQLNKLDPNQILFMNRVIQSNSYKKKIEAIGTLIDSIQRKKTVNKQKTKERKMRKLKIKGQKNSNQEMKQGQSQGPEMEPIDEEVDDQTALKKIYERMQKKNAHSDRSQSINSKNGAQKQVHKKNDLTKKGSLKQIPRQQKKTERSHFIKKGRNKVKEQKKMKKDRYKQRQGVDKSQKEHHIKSHKKEQLHPSWDAKKEQKKEMFISKFMGKKIIL